MTVLIKDKEDRHDDFYASDMTIDNGNIGNIELFDDVEYESCETKINSETQFLTIDQCQLIVKTICVLTNRDMTQEFNWINALSDNYLTAIPNRPFLNTIITGMLSDQDPNQVISQHMQQTCSSDSSVEFSYPVFFNLHFSEDFLSKYLSLDNMTDFQMYHYLACAIQEFDTLRKQHNQRVQDTSTQKIYVDTWMLQYLICSTMLSTLPFLTRRCQDILQFFGQCRSTYLDRYIFSGGLVRETMMQSDVKVDHVFTFLDSTLHSVTDWFCFFLSKLKMLVFS